MKMDQEAWIKSYNAQEQENDIPDDEILEPPPCLKDFFESGDPLTIRDVYNYCQEHFPSCIEKSPSDLTKEEFEKVTDKIQEFISAWYDIEGDHQTRLEHAVRQCELE